MWDEAPLSGRRRTRLLDLARARVFDPAAAAEPEILAAGGGHAADAADAPRALLGDRPVPITGQPVTLTATLGGGTISAPTATTNALGQAARTIVDGSMITVVSGGAGRRELFTFVGVKNGTPLVAVNVAPAAAAVVAAAFRKLLRVRPFFMRMLLSFAGQALCPTVTRGPARLSAHHLL